MPFSTQLATVRIDYLLNLMTLSKARLLAVSAVALTMAINLNAAESLILNFGVYSFNKPSEIVKTFRPVITELEIAISKRLQRNVDIRIQIARNYEQGIDHLVAGDVDFSNIGPASYIEAKRRNQGISILGVEQLNQTTPAYGIIAVHTKSPMQSINDLRGKSFAFGNKGSTIGRFLSQQALVKAGVYEDDLDAYQYLGRHDKVGSAVGAGAFDAGALSYKTYYRLKQSGHPIRELTRFPSAGNPWIARSGMDATVFDAIQTSLLEMNNPAVLSQLGVDGFNHGNDADFAGVRLAIRNNGAFFLKRNSNTTHAEARTPKTQKTEETLLKVKSESRLIEPTHIIADANNKVITIDNADTKITMDNSGNRTLRIDITLPKALFSQGTYSGPETLNVNVTVPSLTP